MEYLRSRFHQELIASINDEGEIIIGEAKFTPDKVLSKLDEIAYGNAFQGWLQERKGILIDKSEEILNLYDNRDRFTSLKAAYNRGVVIPFVGAGLSISSGYPGWTKFLKGLKAQTRITEDIFDHMLLEGEYEELAQLIFDDMRAGSFNEVLENKFGRDFDLNGPVQYLPYIFNSCVITTNFDNVLKRCYDNANCSFSEVVLGADADELLRHLGAGDNILLKLHGKANTGNKRILTLQEYKRYYGDPIELKAIFEAICTKTLLFLGCSLNKDRTLQAMKSLVDEKGTQRAVRHYAILPLEDEDDRLNRRDQLADANIFSIWYPATEDHDEVIEALLLKLQEA